MTRTEELIKFESRAGVTLEQEGTFEESSNTKWLIRVGRFERGRRTWTMWCERNGELVRGSEKTGRNLSSEIRDTFKLK